MPVSDVSGVAATLGAPPPQQDHLAGFAEQLLRIREMKRQTAMSELEAATKIAERDPVLAQEMGAKPLKELTKHTGKDGSELYFQNIYNQAQAKQKQETEMQSALTRKASAEAGSSEVDLQGKQAVEQYRKDLQSGNFSDDEMHARGTALAKAGLVKLMPEDEFEEAIKNYPKDQQKLFKESHIRQAVGLKSFDELAQQAVENTQKVQARSDKLKDQADQLDIQKAQLADQQKRTTLEGDRNKIEQQRVNIDQQREKLEASAQDLTKQRIKMEGRAKVFTAISDFMKTRTTVAMDAAKDMAAMKKAGYPLAPEIEDRVAKSLAESMLKTGITTDSEGEPIGIEDLEKVVEGDVPKGWNHPIDKLLGVTGKQYFFESLKQQGAAENLKDQRKNEDPTDKYLKAGQATRQAPAGIVRAGIEDVMGAGADALNYAKGVAGGTTAVKPPQITDKNVEDVMKQLMQAMLRTAGGGVSAVPDK